MVNADASKVGHDNSIPSVGVSEFAPHMNSLLCNIHRVTFKMLNGCLANQRPRN